jgi:O-antigen/teichoic acid export membrane protein
MNVKKKFKRFSKDKFFRAIATLASGSLIAQSLSIVAAPILTRIYTPYELGFYALILTAESLFGGVICGRYDVAIVTEPDEKKVLPLIKLSFYITVIFSLIATIIYGGYYFVYKDEYNDYSHIIVLILLMLLLNGIMRILEAYNNRYKDFKTIASVYVLKTASQNILTIIFGLLKLSVLGMVLAHIFGLLAGVKKQSQKLIPQLKEIALINRLEMKNVLKEHYRLPIFSTPALFANRFSYTSIMIFIEILFGLATLGFYTIANKLLGLPLSVLSSNVAKVFHQEAAREYDQTGSFIKSFKKTSFLLMALSIPMVIILYLFSPFVFEFVFGEGWAIAGIYVQILAPMFGVRLVVNTVAYGLQIVHKQKLELILQLMFMLVSIGCFIASFQLDFEIEEYLSIVSGSFSFIYVLYFLCILHYAKGRK